MGRQPSSEDGLPWDLRCLPPECLRIASSKEGPTGLPGDPSAAPRRGAVSFIALLARRDGQTVAAKGAQVVMAVRTVSKGEAAADEILRGCHEFSRMKRANPIERPL